MKEYITGISFKNITKEKGSVKALLFYLEEDGTFLAKIDDIVLESVEECNEGIYIAKSMSVNYYLLDCNVNRNAIFYCTSEDKDAIYGTYIVIDNGIYNVQYNYRIDKKFGAFRLLGKSYVSVNEGRSIFVNIDILLRRSKKGRRAR